MKTMAKAIERTSQDKILDAVIAMTAADKAFQAKVAGIMAHFEASVMYRLWDSFFIDSKDSILKEMRTDPEAFFMRLAATPEHFFKLQSNIFGFTGKAREAAKGPLAEYRAAESAYAETRQRILKGEV